MASDAGTAADGIDVGATIRENGDARAELKVAIEGLADDVRDDPCSGEWSVGDIIAHLAGAQAGYSEALEHVAVGEPPRIEGWEPGPPDDWNRATVSARRERDWQRLIADLDTARLQHEAAVRAVPVVTYAAAEEGFPHQWSQARNSAEHYAANTARHERIHIRDIVEWRRKRGL